MTPRQSHRGINMECKYIHTTQSVHHGFSFSSRVRSECEGGLIVMAVRQVQIQGMTESSLG